MQDTQKTWVQSLGWEDPLEEETATHSSILAWRIPWAEEPGRLPCMESQRDSMSPQESPQLHTAHSIPPSVNSSALTFHWILAQIFFLLQAFLLCLLPSPCLIDIFLTSRSVCEIRLKSLGPLFFSIICSIPVFLIITLL